MSLGDLAVTSRHDTVLIDLVERSADHFPHRPAVTFRSESLSYGELRDRTWALAGRLEGLGVRRGDRVVVFLEKRIECVVAILAVSAAGGVVVPANPLFKPGQVGHILRDSGAVMLVTTADRWAALAGEPAPDLDTVLVVDGRDETSESGGRAGGPSVHPWHGRGGRRPAPPKVESDVAAIFYTSGSTGLPKGVVLSHRNLLVGALSVSSYLGNTADDVILAALPLSFDAGFSQLTTAFAVGAHVVLATFLLAADIVRLCETHQVTGLTCVPPLWIQLTGVTWTAEATRSMRYFANTGGRMPRATLDRLRATFPHAAPFLMYGLTEAFRSTYLDPSEIDRRPDSIGKAIPNAEILVVRPDGTPCAPGEVGELVHRGPLVALGYWNDPQRTAERFRPAPAQPPGLPHPELAVWSGDSVRSDEEGFLYFVSRADEMIKTSGYRVSPTEIEEACYQTGLVDGAVAFGEDDDVLGQHIVVVVAAREGVTESQLMAALRAAVPRYMVPQRLQLLATLPRSPNGKFDRVGLKGLVS